MNLDRFEIPEDAEERAWRVVKAAFEERRPVPRQMRLLRPALALAAVAVVAGVAASPPGRAVLGSLREAVGVKKAAPALFSLPTQGRLLVVSQRGPWVVQRDGSKRLLGAYRDASWSPFGRYIAATRTNELFALDPKGNVRWSLARREVHFPRWTGTRVDTRIAYLSAAVPRVVAGDGTNDRPLCTITLAEAVAPAWRPGRRRALAVLGLNHAVYVIDVQSCGLVWRSLALPSARRLEWSSDGTRLLVLTRRGLVVLREGRRVLAHSGVLDAAFRPGTHEVAEIETRGSSSVVLVGGRVVFRGTGELRDLAWSPDGRWLVVTWPTADQWVFVRAAGARRIRGVSGITRQFGGSFPRLAGWCCPR